MRRDRFAALSKGGEGCGLQGRAGCDKTRLSACTLTSPMMWGVVCRAVVGLELASCTKPLASMSLCVCVSLFVSVCIPVCVLVCPYM